MLNLWSGKTKLRFEDIDSGSRARDEGNLAVEGAELDALNGATNLICKYHPRLAISIYYKPEDIFTIPTKIIDLATTRQG